MAEILILEDDEHLPFIFRLNLESLLPKQESLKDTTVRFVETSREFLDYLQDGCKARFYFLDDRVPMDSGCPIDPLFLTHYSALLERKPEAHVFYTGGAPSNETHRFCVGKGIPIIQKEHVPSKAIEVLLAYHNLPLLTTKN